MLAHLVERRLIGGDWQFFGWFASFLPAMSAACSLENARLSVVDLEAVPRGGAWTEAPARGSPSVLPHSQNGYGETIYEVVVHHFEDNRVEGAKELAIDTPGLLGPDDFRALATVVEALAASPPDPAALAEVMRRHGLTPAA